MDYAGFVRRCESSGHLPNDWQRFGLRHPAGSQKPLLERFALQQLHYQECNVLRSLRVVKEIENSADVRVCYFSCKLDLAPEPFYRVDSTSDFRTHRL